MTAGLRQFLNYLVIAGLALIGSVLVVQWSVAMLSTADPLAREACLTCHLAGDEVRTTNATLLTQPPEQLCTRCHPGAVEASHPSGIDPSMAVPDALPLDWKGHVTCNTCHFIHAPDHGRMRVEERGAAFCTSCHDMSFFTQMADQGGSLVVSGHMQSGNDLELAQTDEYSVQCMACHEERGQGPGIELIAGNVARHATGAMEHPIGVDYQKAVQYGGYRPLNQLSSRIALPGGQVSCISCHEGYSSTHGAMVTSNEGSGLCFQCHDL